MPCPIDDSVEVMAINLGARTQTLLAYVASALTCFMKEIWNAVYSTKVKPTSVTCLLGRWKGSLPCQYWSQRGVALRPPPSYIHFRLWMKAVNSHGTTVKYWNSFLSSNPTVCGTFWQIECFHFNQGSIKNTSTLRFHPKATLAVKPKASTLTWNRQNW